MRGMRPARLITPIFTGNSPKEVKFSQMALQAGVVGLMLQDCAWLYMFPNTPRLYEAGVIYKPEKRQVTKDGKVIEYGEDWATIPVVMQYGYGDCEDLGAWRAAELRIRDNIKAQPIVRVRKLPTGAWRAHVMVKWPNGKIEDPSAKLGMYAYGRVD